MDQLTYLPEWSLFFCDGVEKSEYDKWDIKGLIASDEILIAHGGYEFRSTMVLQGYFSREAIGKQIYVKAEFEFPDEEILLGNKYEIGRIEPFDEDPTRFFLYVPFVFMLPSEGFFNINVYCEDELLKYSRFKISYGESPIDEEEINNA